MASAHHPADRERIRVAVAARYGGLARAARAGETITDCDPGEFADDGFGSAGYPDTGDLPEGAVRGQPRLRQPGRGG